MIPPLSSGSIGKEFQREATSRHPAHFHVSKPPQTARPFAITTTEYITAFLEDLEEASLILISCYTKSGDVAVTGTIKQKNDRPCYF